MSTESKLLTKIARLLAAAGCAWSVGALSACVGPGLEPPGSHDTGALPGTPNARGAAAAGGPGAAGAATAMEAAAPTSASTSKVSADAGTALTVPSNGLPAGAAGAGSAATTSGAQAPAAGMTPPAMGAQAADSAETAPQDLDEDAGVPDMGMTP